MLFVGSALKGYIVEASDGGIGTVEDCLFDDVNWKVRWIVVGTGTWLTGRKVLLHPSAVHRVDPELQLMRVNLTKAQVEASPDISLHEPVSQQMEGSLYDYYGAGPLWGGETYFDLYPHGTDIVGSPSRSYGEAATLDTPASGRGRGSDGGDPTLRSMAAVSGYHIRATDGSIGHVENIILDDVGWNVLYLIVDTRNWWIGQHVLISPFAVREIDWADREIRLDVSRDRVKNSPAWDPATLIEEAYQRHLHGHYSWPGYGW